MIGYLGRLVSSATLKPGDARMRPVVRSRSPIAEMDQRIGLVGFEELAAGGGPASPPELEVPAHGEATVAASPDTTTGPAMVHRKVAGGVSAAVSAGLGNTPAPPITPVEATGTSKTSASVSPNTLGTAAERGTTGTPSGAALAPSFGGAETLSRDFLGSDAPNNTDADTDFDRLKITTSVPRSENSPDAAPTDLRSAPEPSLSPRRSLFRNLDQLVSPTGFGKSRATPAAHPDHGAPETWHSSGEPAAPVSLEPSPRIHMPRQAESSPVDDFAPAVKPEAGPRVIVGRINVEVVQPPPVGQTPRAPARPSPMTAASVSKIGPLRPALRSNLLFSLKQR